MPFSKPLDDAISSLGREVSAPVRVVLWDGREFQFSDKPSVTLRLRDQRALQALRARSRGAELEALFALDRELAEARRLASHPLNPRLLAEHLLMAYNRATSGA